MTNQFTLVAAPLRQQIAAAIRDSIVRQDYQAGERLVERILCERFGASRTVVREALRELEGEGLVETIANRGSVVATLTLQQALDLYEVRAVLEALAGRLFTQRATEAQVHSLEAQLERVAGVLTDGGDITRSLVEKDRFYDILLDGAGNAIIRSDLTSIHTRVSLLRAITLSAPSRVVHTVEELRDIVAAIRSRDADLAASLCQAHVEAAQAVAIEALTGTRTEQGTVTK